MRVLCSCKYVGDHKSTSEWLFVYLRCVYEYIIRERQKTRRKRPRLISRLSRFLASTHIPFLGHPLTFHPITVQDAHCLHILRLCTNTYRARIVYTVSILLLDYILLYCSIKYACVYLYVCMARYLWKKNTVKRRYSVMCMCVCCGIVCRWTKTKNKKIKINKNRSRQRVHNTNIMRVYAPVVRI